MDATMDNNVYIILKEERSLNFHTLEKEHSLLVKVAYIAYKDTRVFFSIFSSKEDLEELIAEDKIIDNIKKYLNKYEQDLIINGLKNKGYEYWIGYQYCYDTRIAVNTKED
ncbi:MAG: hypothetical protein ACRDB0_03700 [Paraclostridium sp.]